MYHKKKVFRTKWEVYVIKYEFFYESLIVCKSGDLLFISS